MGKEILSYISWYWYVITVLLAKDKKSWHTWESPYGFPCQVGDVVEWKERDDDHWRKCVVLDVRKRDIIAGDNADKPGLYGFYGMWYGDDPLSSSSYGKIQYLDPHYYDLRPAGVADEETIC